MRRVLFDFHNAAAATTYWPSASGVQAAPGLTEFHTQLDLVGSGGVTYTVEWTGDDSSSTGAQLTADAWKDVTSSCRNLVTGGTRFAASWVDSTCVLDISHITSGRWRVKRVTSDATNDGRGSIMTGAAAHNGLVDVASSALPDDAATETTLAAIEGDTSNMSPAYYPTRGATGPAGGVCLTLPIAGTSSYNAPLVHDMDTGAGTAYGLGVSIRKAGAGGSSALFVTATDRGFVGITDGTNSMPTMDAAARKGFVAVTDGTNTAAVKGDSEQVVASDPSLAVGISPNSCSVKPGIRNTTTPNLADANEGKQQLARDGSLRVNADLCDFSRQMHLVASTAAQQVAFVRTPPTMPFDGIWVSQDDCVVFGQPRGRPYHIVDGLTFADATKWTTAGTDWTIAGNKATHAAGGGGTDTLVGTIGTALKVGETYLVYCKGTKAAGTSATVYCGTAAGTAIAANAPFEFAQVLVCTGNSSCSIVATDDCAIEFTAYQIYPRTPRLPALCYAPFALTEIVGVAAGTTMTTMLVYTAAEVHGVNRRVPGVADLG